MNQGDQPARDIGQHGRADAGFQPCQRHFLIARPHIRYGNLQLFPHLLPCVGAVGIQHIDDIMAVLHGFLNRADQSRQFVFDFRAAGADLLSDLAVLQKPDRHRNRKDNKRQHLCHKEHGDCKDADRQCFGQRIRNISFGRDIHARRPQISGKTCLAVFAEPDFPCEKSGEILQQNFRHTDLAVALLSEVSRRPCGFHGGDTVKIQQNQA